MRKHKMFEKPTGLERVMSETFSVLTAVLGIVHEMMHEATVVTL